jgi:O-antigen ligase
MIFLAPLGWMIVRGWVNGIVMTLSLFCFIFLVSNKKKIALSKSDRLFLITCTLPILAVLITQTLTNNWSGKAYDGPSRFLLGIPVYLYIRAERIDVLRIIAIAIPLSLIFSLISIQINTAPTEFWGNRLATYFVDPLTFGNYSLLLGFSSLISLAFKDESSHYLGEEILKALKLFGFFAGVYISVGSMSRSGWLAAPFLTVFSLWFLARNRRLDIKNYFLGLSLASLILFYLALTNDTLILRIQSIFTEIQAWQTHKQDYDSTSGGTRLSMWILSFKLFLMSPIVGYGDFGYKGLLITHPNLIASAGESARLAMFNGPHNEILANTLRYGLFGLIASTALFITPAITALIAMRSLKNIAAALVFCFITGLLICSTALEVFNLKYTSSFYTFLIPTLLATAINYLERNE